ncbi:polysaccharide deacetylase family protein [Dactylosporangium aurantiacum]|uniref:Polysaccharide deacetylase family protein n=1 Tax=Dactylosporangium aurantiacum TaxID=35754 RepID=A0A9Q9IMY4_9ACTN|nr:polysaccharide deacetylase family protein [Dactylosporangium aurantiacum]MDG6109142.1 polysaccharide deacetylase family protein [Dactylosporangium aurantiacum]UWZ58471.1 polysaccharide deacetylase family protein [Dactylosporangium aurantiacum]
MPLRRLTVFGLLILALTLGGSRGNSGPPAPGLDTPVAARPVVAGHQEPTVQPSVPSPMPSPSASSPVVMTGDGPVGTVRKTGSDAVALTFDDGPWDDTPAVLDLLAKHHVKATFCMVGRQVAARADMVRRMVAEGHTLCNHSWSHDEMLRTRTPEQIRSDMQRTNDAIRAVAPGAVIGYFRAPGGNWSPDIVSIAAGLGMTSISWTVDPRDWSGPGVQSIVNTVLTKTRPGGIVLLHDGAGPQTVAALRTILPDLTGRFTLIALPAPAGAAQP